MPKGIELTVIARTNDKVKIESWYNYWYLVEIAVNFRPSFGFSHQWFWAFGEFIDILKS